MTAPVGVKELEEALATAIKVKDKAFEKAAQAHNNLSDAEDLVWRIQAKLNQAKATSAPQ